MKLEDVIKTDLDSNRKRRLGVGAKTMPELDSNSDANSDARLLNALKGDTITDEEGLSRAYDSDDNVFANGNTLYIAGSKNPFTTAQGRRDWYDDFTKNIKGEWWNGGYRKYSECGNHCNPAFSP